MRLPITTTTIGPEDPGDVDEDLVGRAAQLRLRERVSPDLRRELVRVRGCPDRGHDRMPAARGDERAREQGVPVPLLDGLGLPGEQRLVDREVDRSRARWHRRRSGRLRAARPCRRARPARARPCAIAPSRSTATTGDASSASRSSASLARTSCTTPIAAFAITMPKNSPSRRSPKIRTSTKHTVRIALNSVKTLSRMMCDSGREVVRLVTFASPRATAAATSLLVRPPIRRSHEQPGEPEGERRRAEARG